MAGVACIMVAPLSSSSVRSALPSMAASRGTMTISAPTVSGSSSSSTAMSNDSVVTASSRSLGGEAGLARMLGEEVHDRAVRDAHALGLAGRARGVDHVGRVVGLRVASGRRERRAGWLRQAASVSSANTRPAASLRHARGALAIDDSVTQQREAARPRRVVEARRGKLGSSGT